MARNIKELKVCPWCRTTPEVQSNKQMFRVICNNPKCRMTVHTKWYLSRVTAVNNWERRE